MLLHLPNGRSAQHVRTALARQITSLPEQLRRTLTWDQGKEMADHIAFAVDTGVQVYFCDPHSHGNAEAARTPMVCFGSILLAARAFPFTTPST